MRFSDDSAMAGNQQECGNLGPQQEHKLVESALGQAVVAVPEQKAVVASKTYGKGKVLARKNGRSGQLAFPPSR